MCSSDLYPLVELLTASLSGLIIWQLGGTLAGLSALLLVWMLIAMTFIDLDTQLLPDELTLPLVWLGLLVNLEGTFVPLQDAVIGAAAGYMSLWVVYWMFRLATGKDGIGYGDFKLLAALGAWLGWMMLPVIVLLSSISGALVGLSMIIFRGHQRDQREGRDDGQCRHDRQDSTSGHRFDRCHRRDVGDGLRRQHDPAIGAERRIIRIVGPTQTALHGASPGRTTRHEP